jgi:hypothetical protein
MTGFESKRQAAQAKLEQQQAEPVACQSCQDIGGNWAWKCNLCGEVDESREPEAPQRPWVGLTDEDCKRMSAGDKLVAMWADRTLKERNGY